MSGETVLSPKHGRTLAPALLAAIEQGGTPSCQMTRRRCFLRLEAGAAAMEEPQSARHP